MLMEKRTLTIFCLGWITTVAITACLAGYYYIQYLDYADLSHQYADMYNNLSQNYTELLEDFTRLVENYTELSQKYEAEKTNYTELIQKYEKVVMRVNICINYGNETIIWYDRTLVPLGCNLLNATKMIADVQYTYWPAYEASFVDAINDLQNQHPYYWMWLYWDENEKTWEYGPVGADRYILKPDETIMWRYEIPGW